MQHPVVTEELAYRITNSEADFLRSWLKSIEEQRKDIKLEIGKFGNALAFVTKGIDLGLSFNRVIGVDRDSIEVVDNIIRFYDDYGGRWRIDINPHQSSTDLLYLLNKCGLYQSMFQSVLYGIPKLEIRSDIPSSNVTVREILPDELNVFTEVYHRGYRVYSVDEKVPETVTTLVVETIKGLYGRRGWRLYLAFVEDVPSGVGALYMQSGTATLAMAATSPTFRKMGCHTAMIQQRITDAAREGCDLIVAQAGVGTVSQHNMQRVGLQVACTKAIWTQRIN